MIRSLNLKKYSKTLKQNALFNLNLITFQFTDETLSVVQSISSQNLKTNRISVMKDKRSFAIKYRY